MGSFIKPGGVLVFGVPFVVEGFVLRQVSTYSAFFEYGSHCIFRIFTEGIIFDEDRIGMARS